MGLAASQTRFLSLTARKSDLEFQSQMINTRRMQLAQKSSDAAKAYTEGMNNKAIKIANMTTNTNGITTKEWMTLTFDNLIENYQLIGANGAELVPSPYKEISKTFISDTKLEGYEYNEELGKYTKTVTEIGVDPDYKGMDIQSLLVSGQAQIVSQAFYSYLVEHGYGTGALHINGVPATYEQLVDAWESDGVTTNIPTIIDWRADASSMFKQTNYTEDDAQVAADYEAATAEIQAQDKKLELEVKRIETEHKAIETEMESVKKVIDKNIESSYKSFA